MKDIAHHPKFIQKKVLQEARKKSNKKKISLNSEQEGKEVENTLAEDRRNPEFEGERFDPHHRKPRLLKRINYH